MAAGGVRPLPLVDDRCLKRFGELDEAGHAGRGAGHAAGDDDRILRFHEESSDFVNRARVALWRSGNGEPRDA